VLWLAAIQCMLLLQLLRSLCLFMQVVILDVTGSAGILCTLGDAGRRQAHHQ
jgi:hypothetical protein